MKNSVSGSNLRKMLDFSKTDAGLFGKLGGTLTGVLGDVVEVGVVVDGGDVSNEDEPNQSSGSILDARAKAAFCSASSCSVGRYGRAEYAPSTRCPGMVVEAVAAAEG